MPTAWGEVPAMGVATKPAGTDRPDPVELHRLCVPDPQAPPVAIGSFDTKGPLSCAAFPHRHTFYELVLVTDGAGSHFIDFVGHRLSRRNWASSPRARCTMRLS